MSEISRETLEETIEAVATILESLPLNTEAPACTFTKNHNEETSSEPTSETNSTECNLGATLRNFWDWHSLRHPAVGQSNVGDASYGDEKGYNYIKELVEYLTLKNMLGPVMKVVITEELRVANRASLFRETTVGMSLLSDLWYSSAKDYLKAVIGPIVEHLGKVDHSLEIDPTRVTEEDKKMNFRANAETLLHEISKLLARLYSFDTALPPIFRLVFSAMDTSVSLRFSDVGYAVVGGLLFLRLINPVIIFPAKYGITDNVTPHGARALLIVSKILQTMANNATFTISKDSSMMITNRFVKKNMSKWGAYFHQLITGKVLVDGSSEVNFPVDPEDLINRTNHDLKDVLTCPVTMSKQREVIITLLSLEKQSQLLPAEDHGLWKNVYTRFKGTSKSLSRSWTNVNVSVAELFEYLKDNSWKTSGAKDPEEMKVYSDRLKVLHTYDKLPFPFSDRDYVLLHYCEILPEDEFAIVSCTSIDFDVGEHGFLIPRKKGIVRGELITGFILRAGPLPGTSSVSFIILSDAKGHTSNVPSSIGAKILGKKHGKVVNSLDSLFGAFSSEGEYNEKGLSRSSSRISDYSREISKTSSADSIEGDTKSRKSISSFMRKLTM